LAAQAAAELAYDSFDDRYLGAKSSDPTLDNDGNALLTGALYWNTTSNELKVFNGTSWSLAGSGGSASLLDDTTTNAARYLTFADATSGPFSTAYVSSTKLTYNPSTGKLTAASVEVLDADGATLLLNRNDDDVAASDLLGQVAFYDADGGGTGPGIAASVASYAESEFGASSLRFYTSQSSDGNRLALTEHMRITNTGNVGIGTGAPSTRLELAGNNTNITIGSTPTNAIRFTDTDTSTVANQPTGAIEFYVNDASTGGTGIGSAIQGRAVGTSGGGYLSFGTSLNGSTGTVVDRFQIGSDGQLFNNVVSQVGTDYTELYKGYFCRAWVNFNGTGTPAINASGNVSSITDGGTGVFTANFTTALPDANYSAVATTIYSSLSVRPTCYMSTRDVGSVVVRVLNEGSGVTFDPSYVGLTVVR
jgi:hypothetical protein